MRGMEAMKRMQGRKPFQESIFGKELAVKPDYPLLLEVILQAMWSPATPTSGVGGPFPEGNRGGIAVTKSCED